MMFIYRCNQQYRGADLEEEVREARTRFIGNILCVRVGKHFFVVIVYCIWQERNK